MVSAKIASIIAVAAFIAGSFLASSELRAYAAATITGSDIADGTIESIDIKDGQIKAADIATAAVGSNDIFDGGVNSNDLAKDSVSGRELQGMDMFTIVACGFTNNQSVAAGAIIGGSCHADHVHDGWSTFATVNRTQESEQEECFVLLNSEAGFDDIVFFKLRNICSSPATLGTIDMSIWAWR
jgi:hypothetical protein